MNSQRVKVVLADDHPMIFPGITMFLQRGLNAEVVATAETARDAVGAVVAHYPDVLILDLKLPEEGGCWVLSQIRSTVCRTKTVVFTGSEDYDLQDRALDAGASAIVKKSRQVQDLPRIIAEMLGVPYGQQEEEDLESRRSNPLAQLTPRQRRVIKFVALGHTNAQVAEALGISTKTVDTHRQRAMSALGLMEKRQLVELLLEAGIIGRAG